MRCPACISGPKDRRTEEFGGGVFAIEDVVLPLPGYMVAMPTNVRERQHIIDAHPETAGRTDAGHASGIHRTPQIDVIGEPSETPIAPLFLAARMFPGGPPPPLDVGSAAGSR